MFCLRFIAAGAAKALMQYCVLYRGKKCSEWDLKIERGNALSDKIYEFFWRKDQLDQASISICP